MNPSRRVGIAVVEEFARLAGVLSRFGIGDGLWERIAPLIPARQRRSRHPGRKAIDDRLVLNGILHVLHTGIACTDLPAEHGYGSRVTRWRRLREWRSRSWRICTDVRPPAGPAGHGANPT